MNYDNPAEIIAFHKTMRSELSRLKRRQIILEFYLARIYFYQFLLSGVYVIAKIGFNIFDFIKKFIGRN